MEENLEVSSKRRKTDRHESERALTIHNEGDTMADDNVVDAGFTEQVSSEEKKRGNLSQLEGEYQMDLIGEEIQHVTDSVADELEDAASIQEYYRPWAAMHILGIPEHDLVRFTFVDRDRKKGELDYEGIWLDKKTGEERGTRGRLRIFGMAQLETLVLSKAALVNIKPHRGEWVAIDAIRMFDPFGNRLPWGSYETAGLILTMSAKLTKRLSTLTRDSFICGVWDPGVVRVDVVWEEDLQHYVDDDRHCDDKMLDGANAVSMAWYIHMCEQGFKQARLTHEQIIEDIDAQIAAGKLKPEQRRGRIEFMKQRARRIWKRLMRSKRGQFRMVDADGVWKGDYIVSDKEHLSAGQQEFDVRVFYKNCKSEMKWTQGTFIHLEPHPDNGEQIVYTDEQTHSWLLRHIFSQETLTECLRDVNAKLRDELAVGTVPDHIRKWMEVEDEQEEEDRDRENDGQISDLQHIIAAWSRGGFNLRNSRWIIMQLGVGHLKMLNSPKRGRRFPMPGAARHHVATNAWLRMAEYEECAYVEQGSARYCEEVQSFVFADRDFVKLYARHGGWDLDDTIVAIHAKVERSGREIWIIYRSPNGYGEYSILNYDGESPRPRWIREREDNMVTLSKLPKFLEDVSQEYGDLPEPAPKSETFDIAAIKQAINEAPGARNIGIWANTQMAWYWTNDGPRPSQLCPTEFVADACMQDRDPERIKLVERDIELTMEQLAASDKPINRDLWKERIRRPMDAKTYSYTDSGLRQELRNKFEAATQEFMQQVKSISLKAGDAILPLLDFNWSITTKTMSRRFRKHFADTMQWYRTNQIDLSHDQWNEIASDFNTRLGMNTQEDRTKLLLHTAFVRYSNKGKDKILFQFNRNDEKSVVHYYIEALQAACFRNLLRCL